ncbi:Non-classical arabinogalactan protein 31 [Camellia lanceoleosa]|nr:Non-classical arabinogalactan protein 31 [Camellia lanceoleosa]
MGFVPVKALAHIQFTSVLLLSTVYGDVVDLSQSSPPPPPQDPPSSTGSPPSHPYPHPPSYLPKRCLVAVQGLFCKPCKYTGVDTLLEATPLLGAIVKLECNNTKYPITQEGKTDKNGYFFIEGPKKITNYGAHKCKVFLVSSPQAQCSNPSNLHDGKVGATLKRSEKKPSNPPLPYELYSVGPLPLNLPPDAIDLFKIRLCKNIKFSVCLCL